MFPLTPVDTSDSFMQLIIIVSSANYVLTPAL